MSKYHFGAKVDPQKQKIRERVWNMMEQKGIARFPGAFGRIPNFVGAEDAARKASQMEVFRKAKVIKSNPDSPQRKLREIALSMGKLVYMAVPRLREKKCFVELNPVEIPQNLVHEASTIKGAFKYGKLVSPNEMRKVDLIIAGSVAVNLQGQRIGKGGGFSDLEFAIGREFGLIDEDTPVLTTVHEIQILDSEVFPWKPHDIPVDFIVTPSRVVETRTEYPKPEEIYWELLTKQQLELIPILRDLKEARRYG